MLILKPTLALINGSLRGSYKPLAMQPCVSPLITSLPTPGRRPRHELRLEIYHLNKISRHMTS